MTEDARVAEKLKEVHRLHRESAGKSPVKSAEKIVMHEQSIVEPIEPAIPHVTLAYQSDQQRGDLLSVPFNRIRDRVIPIALYILLLVVPTLGVYLNDPVGWDLTMMLAALVAGCVLVPVALSPATMYGVKLAADLRNIEIPRNIFIRASAAFCPLLLLPLGVPAAVYLSASSRSSISDDEQLLNGASGLLSGIVVSYCLIRYLFRLRAGDGVIVWLLGGLFFTIGTAFGTAIVLIVMGSAPWD